MLIKNLTNKRPYFLLLFTAMLMPAILISLGENIFLAMIAVFVFFIFLLVFYKWPWALIILLILVPLNFFYFLDITFLPTIKIVAGIRVDFLDLLILCVFIVGVMRFFIRRTLPLFGLELLFLLVSIGLSLAWGLYQGYIDFDVALGGLRPLFAFIFYISLIPILYKSRDKRRLVNLLMGVSIIAMGIQVYEVLFGALVLPTSTPWYVNGNISLSVGDVITPYLWNRAPAILFLVYNICLARWFIAQKKISLLLAAAIFICVALTHIRSMLIFICLESLILAVIVYFSYSRSRGLVLTSIFFAILLGTLLIVFGTATDSVGVARLKTLMDPIGDSSFNTRIRATQLFYEYFSASPLVGHGPGSVSLIEKKYGIWSTDVGLISSLAGYGLLVFFSLSFLLYKVFKNLKYVLRLEKNTLEIADAYGILGFFFLALISSLSLQNYFFISPWNYSTAIALVMLDILVRNIRRQEIPFMNPHAEKEN